MMRGGLLLCVPLLVQCAAARHTPEIARPGEPSPVAAATTKPPAAPGTATPSLVDEPSSSIHSTDEKPASSNETWGGIGLSEVTEKDWLAGVRQKLAAQHKVEPGALIFSPGKLRALFVRDPAAAAAASASATATKKKPPARPRPRRFQIVVVDNQGRKLASFRPITARGSDEPPKDVKFLGEDRLIYEVVSAPPPPAADASATPPPIPDAPASQRRPAKTNGKPNSKPNGKPNSKPGSKANRKTARASHATPRPGAARSTHLQAPAPPAPSPSEKQTPPPRLFVIQSLEPRARPLRCEGTHFTFTAQNDRIAFVGGPPEAAFVAVDGAQVYPRRGRGVIPGPVAWSKDGRSLAFIEAPAVGPARLVLVADYENPTGDTTWDLPASTPIDGTRVFWAGAGKLVVGKTPGHPLFSTSFQKQLPPR